MKIIKQMVTDIRDEMEGAEHYAKLATQYKLDERVLADNYAKMAETELGHVNDLHAQAVRLIKEQRASGVTTPPSMQAVWDWEHELMVDTVARIKAMLAMYKGA